jgi:hypothetical protein
LEMRLDLDVSRVEADECVSDRPCKHHSTVRRDLSQHCHEIVPKR